MLTLQEKILAVESSNSFADLSKEVLPTTFKEDYYFVSYSHKDYKKVLKDILLLEDKGINIWYDSDMHIGENWEHIAETYISKFQCKGIIFYLSENSVLSPACNKEIEYVLENDKQFFSINIPLDGKNVTSGARMLQDLKAEGRSVSDYTLSLFERAFPDTVLFLAESDSIERKCEKIAELVGEDLFQITSTYSSGQEVAVLDECKDNTMVALKIKNNYRVNDPGDTSHGELLPLREISACAFTNSFKLKEVSLPKNLKHIRENAFRNCGRLRSINLDDNLFMIGNATFKNCKNLAIDYVGAKNLADSVFWGCEKLSNLTLACRFIGRYGLAFAKNLKSVTFTQPQYLFSASTFAECESLSDIYYNLDTPNCIIADKESAVMEREYLSGAKALTHFTIKGDVDIEKAESAFHRATSLERFTFDIASPHTLPRAFLSGAVSLKEVIGFEFKVIGEEAFQGTSSLKDINLNDVEVINDRAFLGSGIEKVSLPAIKEIGRQAFFKSNLKSLNLSKNLTSIGSQAFACAYNLESINILSKDLILDDTSVFYGVRPTSLLVSNTSQLEYFMEHASSALEVLYLREEMDTPETLALIPLPFVREDCKINGVVKLRITPSNPFKKFLDRRVVIKTVDDEIHTRITQVGYDEEREEYFLECFERFYESEIVNVEIDVWYE